MRKELQRAKDEARRQREQAQKREAEKEELDRLHKRKIDLADEVLVLNVGGYVGSSTRSEVEYAALTGKPVRWLEPGMVPDDLRGCGGTPTEEPQPAEVPHEDDSEVILYKNDGVAWWRPRGR